MTAGDGATALAQVLVRPAQPSLAGQATQTAGVFRAHPRSGAAWSSHRARRLREPQPTGTTASLRVWSRRRTSALVLPANTRWQCHADILQSSPTYDHAFQEPPSARARETPARRDAVDANREDSYHPVANAFPAQAERRRPTPNLSPDV